MAKTEGNNAGSSEGAAKPTSGGMNPNLTTNPEGKSEGASNTQKSTSSRKKTAARAKEDQGRLVAIFGFRMKTNEYEKFVKDKPEINATQIAVVKDEEADCYYLGRQLSHASSTGGLYASFDELREADSILDAFLRRTHGVAGSASIFVEYIED